MYEHLEQILPESVLKSNDIALLRDIRAYADARVQEIKKQKEEKELKKFTPDLEGKFIVQHGDSWDGPCRVPNLNDTQYVYIKKLDFVGHGFVRCKAVIFNIDYGDTGDRVNRAGLCAKDYDHIRVACWQDDSFDLSFEAAKNPTYISAEEVRKEIEKIFIQDNDFENMYVTILSFGFKYGLPSDADLIFDVRFMPNPYYKEDMKHKTGLDEDVRNYVMNSDDSREFLVKLIDMVKFLMPKYVKEGKNQLVIAIGCTGGKHRSVTVAESLYKNVKEDKNIGFKLYHRDIER